MQPFMAITDESSSICMQYLVSMVSVIPPEKKRTHQRDHVSEHMTTPIGVEIKYALLLIPDFKMLVFHPDDFC